MIDILSDTIARIKVAQQQHKKRVKCFKSNLVCNFLRVLWDEGFIEGYEEEIKEINIILSYQENESPTIKELKRCSRPGCRIYLSIKDLHQLTKNTYPNYGIHILSTNKGVITSQKALEIKAGGELLCFIS